MVRTWFSRAAGQVAAGLDQLFNDAVLGNGSPAPDHEQRMAGLARVAAFYNRPELAAELFPQPAAIAPELRRIGRTSVGGELLELQWKSAFSPLWSDGEFAQRFL